MTIKTMSVTCPIVNVPAPACVDTTWTCREDRLEHSNCGNTRKTTPCDLASDAMEMIIGTRPVDLRYDVNNNGFVDTGDATLLAKGTPLRSLSPANITATAGTATSPITGEIDINITWKNTGEQAGSFVPKASIDGGAPIDLGVGTITLAPGATYNAAKALTGSGITPGAHTVCPVPN